MTPLDTVLAGDCFKVAAKLPEHFAALGLVDPPYNIATEGKLTMKGGGVTPTAKAWGEAFNDNMTTADYAKMMKDLALLMDRSLTDDASLLIFYDRGNPESLTPFAKLFKRRNVIAFVKRNPGPHFRKNNYRSGFELCEWFSREKYRINFVSQREMVNVFEGNVADGKATAHPCEKPAWMIEPLILRHSRPGDLVFDPMCGSGSSLVAAKKLGRRYLGVELEPRWVRAAEERLAATEPIQSFDAYTAPLAEAPA